MSESVFLSNLHYFCAQTDGAYKFPNSAEGDLLKRAKIEVEALQRDNAALRQDKERLDWLEETLISLYATPTPDMSGARIRGQLRNKRRDDSGAAGPSYIRLFHASIRAAIDAARKYEGQK